MTEIWGEAVRSIEGRVKPANRDQWLRLIECLGISEGRIRLRAPNRFHKEWFEDNFLPSILENLQERAQRTFAVEFEVAEEVPMVARSQDVASESVVGDENGLMGRSLFCLDTTNAAGVVNVSADIADAKGPGGGAFVLKKCGAGVLQLSGNSSYTGQTILEAGTLSVASLNSVVNGRPGSSLGAPVDVDAGEIVLGDDGKDGDCTLVYTGPGEITDRVMNFVGKQSTVTFDQSGSGLLKFTGTFLLSGYGAGKTIILKGDTAGRGEIAGNIVNPHDRAGKATTAVTKLGSGTWTLSGTNSYSGPTKVGGGVLACARAAALGGGAVDIRGGAELELNYHGTCRITALTLKGRAQAAGSYGSTASPATYTNDACFFRSRHGDRGSISRKSKIQVSCPNRLEQQLENDTHLTPTQHFKRKNRRIATETDEDKSDHFVRSDRIVS